MGKKSSQKKLKKLSTTEKNTTGDISTKKSTTKNPANNLTESPTENQTADMIRSPLGSRLFGLSKKTFVAALMVAGLIVLAFFAIFIWGELTKPASIAKFIPQDAVGFVEFDTKIEGNNWQNYNNLTEGKNLPTISALIGEVNTMFTIDIMKDVYPWLSRRAGVALLSDAKGAIFLEVTNEKQALDFFRQHRLTSITEDLKEETIEGVKTYHYIASSPLALAFLGNYLVVASDTEAIGQIIKATKEKSLFSNGNFQRIHNAVPQKNRLGFVFMRPGQLTQMMQSLPSIVSGVLTQNFTAEGVSMKALDDMFIIEHVALFAQKKSSKNEKKYRGNLIGMCSDKTQLYIGGENFASISDKINGMFSDPSANIQPQAASTNVLTLYLEEAIKSTFDGNISVNDIKTLLAGEYGFAIDNGQMKAVIELTNPAEQEKILKKMIQGVESSRVLFQPIVENDTIKGSAKNMKSSKDEYKGIAIQATEIEGDTKGIYLAIVGDTAIITLSKEEMHRTIDTINGSVPTLKSTQAYEKYFEPQLQAADDIIYARPHDLSNMLPDVLKFLGNISEISLSTNSFEDAVKTIIFFSP